MRGDDAKSLLKKLFEAKGNNVKSRSIDRMGNISFGILEHIDIPGIKYDPKIGILGINPHCESIDDFNEDDKIIRPIIKKMKSLGHKISGPHSADTIFLKKNRLSFDVIIGMYHDQVLTPIKTLFEYDAINITLGLPFIRISPDHGPNEKMLGKNLSNPLSLIKAIMFLDSKND